VVLTALGEARVVQVGQLSLATFPMLGIRPVLGREFGPGEDRLGADHVVVLSYSAWLRYFAQDPNVLKRSLMLDNIAHRVIGVMPQTFEFPDAKTEFWKPLVVAAAARGQISVFPVMARLQEGVSSSAAAAEVNGISRRIRGETQLSNNKKAGPDRIEIVPVKEEAAAVSRPALLVLTVAACFVLLIACANVSNLLLARTTSRGREIAIRTSLGADRNRLIRQTIVESVVLALVAGIVGMCFAFAANQLLLTHWPGNVKAMQSVPRLDHLTMNGSVLLFTLGISLLTGLLFGMPPAFLIAHTDNLAAIKEGVALSSESRLLHSNRTLNLLVIAETGMSFALFAAALLLIQSFLKLSSLDPGFDTRHVLTFQVASPPGTIRDAFNTELGQRLRSIPGIEAAGYGELLPLELDNLLIRPLRIPGISDQAIMAQGMPRTLEGSWDYFRSIGMHLVSGRWLEESDGSGRPQVMLVNRAFARRFFANTNPIGKSVFSLGTAPWEIV